MKVKAALLGAAVVLSAGSAGLVGSPAQASTSPHAVHSSAPEQHPCTRTSSGTCIRGGGFCPQSSYNHSGWDAQGRRYVCKGDHTHPHWMKP